MTLPSPLLRGMVPPGYSPPLGYRGGPVLTRDGCSQPRAVFQTIGCFRSGPPQQQAGGRQVTAQRHRPLAGLILRSLGTSLRMVRRSRSNELRGTFRPMLAVSRRMAPYLLVRVCEKRTISSHTLNCTAVPFPFSTQMLQLNRRARRYQRLRRWCAKKDSLILGGSGITWPEPTGRFPPLVRG